MIEGKRAVIFVGVLLNVLLLNQPVTSSLKADSGINYYWIESRVYERFSHPNSSATNRGEIERHRSDVARFRSGPSRIITNVPLHPPARFSFIGRSDDHFQFERQRRIFREPLENRQERNRVIDDAALSEPTQRRIMKMDFDNRRYLRSSEAQPDRSIRRRSFSLSERRFSNSESSAILTTLNRSDRRINSRVRDTRNSEFILYRTRELRRITDQFRNRETRLMRTVDANRDQISIRERSKNSETSSLAHSIFKSTLSPYFSDNSIPSFKLYQINDFVVSTIAGILLYDIMGAMTQNKAVPVKKEFFGSFVDKMVFAVRKMVAH